MHSHAARVRCSVAAERIAIEVACARGTSARPCSRSRSRPAALRARPSNAPGILALHPAINAATCGVGIFGREVPRERVLAAGDRVEVLRPLVEDPKRAAAASRA